MNLKTVADEHMKRTGEMTLRKVLRSHSALFYFMEFVERTGEMNVLQFMLTVDRYAFLFLVSLVRFVVAEQGAQLPYHGLERDGADARRHEGGHWPVPAAVFSGARRHLGTRFSVKLCHAHLLYVQPETLEAVVAFHSNQNEDFAGYACLPRI